MGCKKHELQSRCKEKPEARAKGTLQAQEGTDTKGAPENLRVNYQRHAVEQETSLDASLFETQAQRATSSFGSLPCLTNRG